MAKGQAFTSNPRQLGLCACPPDPAAKAMKQRKSHVSVLRESLVHGTGVLVSQFISAVRGLVVAGLLGEARYGLWKSVQVGLDYLAYSHFGVLHGMARLVPLFRKSGERGNELAARYLALLVALATAVVAGLLLVAFTSGAERHLWHLWIGIALLLIPNQLIRYLSWVCLADGKFAVLSVCDILAASVSFVVMWWIVPSWGVLGVLAGLGVGFTSAIAVGWVSGMLPSWKDRKTCTNVAEVTKNLVQAGFPFMFVDGLFVVWQRIDRVVLVTLYGAETKELGWYGLAVMVASFAIQIPQTLMRVLFRRTVTASEENLPGTKETASSLQKHVELPARVVAGTTPVLLGLGTVASWVVIRAFLPGYREAEVPIAVLMLASYWAGVGLSLRNLYTATNRQWRLGGIYSLSIATTVLSIYLMAWFARHANSMGIRAGAIGMVVGSLVFAVVSLADTCRHLDFTLSQFGSLLLKITGPFLALSCWTWLALGYRTPVIIHEGLSMERLAFDLATCLLITGPAAFWTIRTLFRRNTRTEV